MLPTTTPPLSKALFQLTPKSWRLIVALAVKLALAFGPFPEQSQRAFTVTEVSAQLQTRGDVQK
jgi:hypothetical protein